jgi:probable rRNA maturation factor
MSKITVRADRAYRRYIEPRRLKEAVFKTLAHENVSGRVELTIAITGDDQIEALNRQYRSVDSATDVLAFGQATAEARFAAMPGAPAYLGDVIISYPRADAQARSGGHSATDELLLLVVHGVLHLLGHDHATRGQKRKMWAAQENVLRELGARFRVGKG